MLDLQIEKPAFSKAAGRLKKVFASRNGSVSAFLAEPLGRVGVGA